MHQRAVGLGGEVGHAREVEDRQVLGVGAGHRTDRAELADAVGGADGADTPDAGVAVGGVGGVEFIAAADPVDIGMRDDGVLHGEGEIAWHTEDIGHADVAEPVQHVIDDGGGGHEETPWLGSRTKGGVLRVDQVSTSAVSSSPKSVGRTRELPVLSR